MKKYILILIITVLPASLAYSQNVILNGDFETGAPDPWWIFVDATSAAATVDYSNNTVNFTEISKVGNNTYDLALIQDLNSEQISELSNNIGSTYYLSFDAKVSENRICSIFFGEVQGNWYNLANGVKFTLKADQTKYSASFKVTQVFDQMKLGMEIGTSAVPVEFDNVVVSTEPVTIGKGRSLAVDYTIYPNPAHDFLRVDAKKGAIVGLYSLTGQLIKTKQVVDESVDFEISTMARGIYLVKIRSERTENIEKVIFR